jgi:hypothetical protein
MKNGFVIFSKIKLLLNKYNIIFETNKEYEEFMRELIDILEI